VTPEMSIQAPAPEGLNCRLKLVAVPCMLSIAGAAHVTMRPPPVPCPTDTAPGIFGICDANVVDPGCARGSNMALGRIGVEGVAG
jgi:hypothetical protein